VRDRSPKNRQQRKPEKPSHRKSDRPCCCDGNLDVAVVIALPVALSAGRCLGLPAIRLALAVAMTANAASFLLPTSNITNLLLLGRAPLTTAAYVGDSWLPWILVIAVTLGALPIWTDAARRRAKPTPSPTARSSAPYTT